MAKSEIRVDPHRGLLAAPLAATAHPPRRVRRFGPRVWLLCALLGCGDARCVDTSSGVRLSDVAPDRVAASEDGSMLAWCSGGADGRGCEVYASAAPRPFLAVAVANGALDFAPLDDGDLLLIAAGKVVLRRPSGATSTVAALGARKLVWTAARVTPGWIALVGEGDGRASSLIGFTDAGGLVRRPLAADRARAGNDGRLIGAEGGVVCPGALCLMDAPPIQGEGRSADVRLRVESPRDWALSEGGGLVGWVSSQGVLHCARAPGFATVELGDVSAFGLARAGTWMIWIDRKGTLRASSCTTRRPVLLERAVREFALGAGGECVGYLTGCGSVGCTLLVSRLAADRASDAVKLAGNVNEFRLGACDGPTALAWGHESALLGNVLKVVGSVRKVVATEAREGEALWVGRDVAYVLGGPSRQQGLYRLSLQ